VTTTTIRQVGDIVVIDFIGRVSGLENSNVIHEAVEDLVRKGNRKLVINLSQVPYIDSIGLCEIVRTYTALSRLGGKIAYTCLSKPVLSLLNVTKLLTILPVYDDEGEAIKSFEK
jgi:anti-sigma B factor antagonist